MATESQSSGYAVYSAAIVVLLWVIYGTFYRLYLHPLSKFPGPKLAIITYWFEFYYDVIRGGQYTWKLKELHDQYGPIVRINPNELHINDPDYYDEYSPGAIRRIEKPKSYAECFGPTENGFATVSHEHHRLRRSAISPYFSKRSIHQYAPVIQGVIDKLCTRLEKSKQTGELINLQYAYAAMTTDVINEYCFSRTYDAVLTPDFNVDFYESVMAMSKMFHVVKQMPWVFNLLNSLPDWFVKATNPELQRFLSDETLYALEIENIRSGKNTSYETSGHHTLFHELLSSDLPASEKESKRLGDEARGIIGAGTFTTAHAIKITTYHIIANPGIHQRLATELEDLMPNPAIPAPLSKVEQLPYLSAVVLEGLRLSYGISHRLCRSSPDVCLSFHGQAIPAGTPVSMSNVLMHDNPSIFPEPSVFKPERWLQGGQQRLQRYLVPFGKGTRMCAGMNLAMAEIYLTLASVLRRFSMELVDCVRERDVDVTRDFFNTSARVDSKGMNIRVVG